MKVDNIAQKNICQESFMFQNEETSSIENRSPPTGAPNAEATPAAAPALIKLRLQKPAFYIYWSEDNVFIAKSMHAPTIIYFIICPTFLIFTGHSFIINIRNIYYQLVLWRI